ncbi:MAG: leucine-rich repeat protein [Ruminococcus flavefaciens]|nr:leucine-rich repeat protein [Ruminococcus flavefaciens]
MVAFKIPDRQDKVFTISTIGNYAFSGCKTLSKVTLSKSLQSMGYGVFNECDSLTSVEIPKSLTSISSSTPYVFQGCDKLTNITFENGTTKIASYLFANCDSITSITIPSGVKEIGGYAFYGCDLLDSVVIPYTTTSIGSNAFNHCDYLTSVKIPESVTNIGSGAFSNCKYLTISGYANSYAETYAKTNSIPFTSLGVATLKDITSGITVTAGDNFAENVSLKIEEKQSTVTAPAEVGSVVASYDISLMKDGISVQPSSTIKISIPVPTESEGSKLKVYRQETNGSFTDMKAVYDSETNSLIFETTHLSVYVLAKEKTAPTGDLNNDGIVNNKDLTLLRRALANGNTEEYEDYADINSDGVVNNKDLSLLRRMLAGA